MTTESLVQMALPPQKPFKWNHTKRKNIQKTGTWRTHFDELFKWRRMPLKLNWKLGETITKKWNFINKIISIRNNKTTNKFARSHIKIIFSKEKRNFFVSLTKWKLKIHEKQRCDIKCYCKQLYSCQLLLRNIFFLQKEMERFNSITEERNWLKLMT